MQGATGTFVLSFKSTKTYAMRTFNSLYPTLKNWMRIPSFKEEATSNLNEPSFKALMEEPMVRFPATHERDINIHYGNG